MCVWRVTTVPVVGGGTGVGAAVGPTLMAVLGLGLVLVLVPVVGLLVVVPDSEGRGVQEVQRRALEQQKAPVHAVLSGMKGVG